MRFWDMLTVRAVPVVSWSSSFALNFRPRFVTVLGLCLGLTIFGSGEALMIAAGVGVSPWTVLAQGLALRSGWSIGAATFSVSVFVLLLWIPLRQQPGLGTLANAVIIALAMQFMLPWLPQPQHLAAQLMEAVFGIVLVGLGSGIYLVANLGPGPRDGLMTGLQRVSGFPVAWVRTAIEVTVVLLGWALGGVVGLGTLMFAVGIGWAVSLGLFFVKWVSLRGDRPGAITG